MLNIAIVGTGNIAPSHVEGLLTFPERCKIVALCDIYPEKAQAMKEKYHLDCQVFDDHQKMLAAGVPIDVVHVCTPPYTHAEIAIHSMDAGKNVVVEKAHGHLPERVRRDAGRRGAQPRDHGLHCPEPLPGFHLQAAGDAEQRPGRQAAGGPCELPVVARPLLLRPVVAGPVGEGGRRLHLEPRRPPHRHDKLDEGASCPKR